MLELTAGSNLLLAAIPFPESVAMDGSDFDSLKASLWTATRAVMKELGVARSYDYGSGAIIQKEVQFHGLFKTIEVSTVVGSSLHEPKNMVQIFVKRMRETLPTRVNPLPPLERNTV